MTGHSRAFYRSEFTRWLFIGTGCVSGYSISPWGPTAWRQTPSLQLLHTVIPWPVMTALFAVYVLLLLTARLPAVMAADILGLGLYLCTVIAMILTTRIGQPANLILASAGALAVGYHFMAARLAFLQIAVEEAT